MALVHTPDPEFGATCPDFELPSTNGKTISLSQFKDGKPLLVLFMCNHCPYVKAILDRLVDLGNYFKSQGIHMVAISSNDVSRYPDDSFDKMKELASEMKFPFPYCYDEDQSVAKAFGAVCTPDFFGYDSDLKLVYRGRLDDNWKEPENVSNEELKTAMTEILQGKEISFKQTPSMGCSLKWIEA